MPAETFAQRLAEATQFARNQLRQGGNGANFDLTDNRAGAYLAISRVLMAEAAATGITRYRDAAIMLQEQAEITTCAPHRR